MNSQILNPVLMQKYLAIKKLSEGRRNKIKVSAELQLNNMLFTAYQSVTLSGSSCLCDEVGLVPGRKIPLISYPLLIIIYLGM